MNTKHIIKAMKGGATLCMSLDDEERTFWLEPLHVKVRRDHGERLIADPRLAPNQDGLFHDLYPQTWRIAG